ncbi:alkyl hydroperoxide reductase/ Thiol specific antioxidant/ Mal allergen [Thalassoporum mexicanum PCC 7367]|uniref:thioredoxin-dependent thiol peroxidase n=1 Tax=Thalassoporum mexicanum TaxID=3457544 RepID=UPI00029F9162|nr:thioredoxin-dependent thiol peroxidase [Pseudanabaena sp. PCC 7367]AFY71016.1 alkyl hydroperoxide reductase/ Thiol specific antioxidant/ Mal allergen [Pseudanabaena sp. PCC 7367]
MTLNPGDPAPDFTLQDTAGNTVTLSELRGKRVVLYFYPKDDTPGCTKEACGFRDNYATYQDKDMLVYGISKDDAKSHAKFTDKYQLPFPLLCDTDTTVAKAYESYGLKKFMGKEFEGTFRHTFVIDPEGKIEKIYTKVKAEQHATDILADLGLA